MWRKCLAAPSRELTLRERVLDMRATKGVTLVQTSYVERERERQSRQTETERERERERQRERENRSVNLLILLGWELC